MDESEPSLGVSSVRLLLRLLGQKNIRFRMLGEEEVVVVAPADGPVPRPPEAKYVVNMGLIAGAQAHMMPV